MVRDVHLRQHFSCMPVLKARQSECAQYSSCSCDIVAALIVLMLGRRRIALMGLRGRQGGMSSLAVPPAQRS